MNGQTEEKAARTNKKSRVPKTPVSKVPVLSEKDFGELLQFLELFREFNRDKGKQIETMRFLLKNFNALPEKLQDDILEAVNQLPDDVRNTVEHRYWLINKASRIKAVSIVWEREKKKLKEDRPIPTHLLETIVGWSESTVKRQINKAISILAQKVFNPS